MAKFAPHMGDPHGDPQTSPQNADSHGFLEWFSLKKAPKSMWIGVLRAGLRGRHVDNPCGGAISPWPARKVNFRGGMGLQGDSGPPLPKGPRRTKNTTRSKFTTRSEFTIALWFAIAAHLVRTPFSWELQTFFLSKKGLRRSKYGGSTKNTTP